MDLGLEEVKKEWLQMRQLKLNDTELLKSNNCASNVADYFEFLADKFQNRPAIVAVEKPEFQLTYSQLDTMANQLANFFITTLDQSEKPTAALLMENRPEFPSFTVAMAKCGVTTALINFNLTGRLLLHALKVAQVSHCFVSQKYLSVIMDLKNHKDNSMALDAEEQAFMAKLKVYHVIGPYDDVTLDTPIGVSLLDIQSLPDNMKQRPSKKWRSLVKERDAFVYIYTSGTTGPSKAAVFSHRRWIGCGLTWNKCSQIKQDSVYYIPLPLYHGNGGAVALSSIFFCGALAVTRQRFSVSQFFADIRQFTATHMIYVGELWRYLCNIAPSPTDSKHSLRTIVGNGLSKCIWLTVQERFGVERIVEHYGSTEMPGDAVIQWFGKPGSCGYVPVELMSDYYAGMLIKFDIAEGKPVKNDEECWAIKCGFDEPGELVMPLPDGKYDGYVDPSQTEKKLYRNVFAEGDVWFSTGDILKVDNDGFFYFIDRTGDSFRWKGENVSTTEVQDVISKLDIINEVTVYGVSVPNYGGKAGMAAITLKHQVDIDEIRQKFAEFLSTNLPEFAVPVFIRILSSQKAIEKTSTIKFQKHAYTKAGYDLDACGADDVILIYDRLEKIYNQLTQAVFNDLKHGNYKKKL